MVMGIYQFLSRNDFFKNKDNPRTHTIMSGGVLHVAEDMYDEFLGVYAAEIKRGNRTLAFSEIRSPNVFRMYFDVDILDTEALGEEFLFRLARSVQTTIVKFFRGADQDAFKCVLCATATKEVEVSELVPLPQKPIGIAYSKKEEEMAPEPERVVKKFTKNGYHILFPFLRVTLQMALQLRFSVVRDLEKNLGKRPVAVNPWVDVIDKAPYYNGLKMCGSVKSVTCTECKGKKKNVRRKPVVKDILHDIRKLRKRLYPRRDDPSFDYSNVMSIAKDEFKNEDLADLFHKYQSETGHLMCPKCNDKGSHLEDRFYMPMSVLDSDGSVSEADFEYLNGNMHEMMRWTSIRCRPSDEATEGYFTPRGYPSPTPDRATGSLQVAGAYLERLSPGIYREAVNAEMFTNDALGIKTWKGNEIVDPLTLDLINREVRAFSPHYNELDVRQVFEVKVAKSYQKSVISADTKTNNTTKVQASAVQKSLPTPKPAKGGSATKMLTKIAIANKVASATDRVLEVFSRVQVRVTGPGSTYCTNKGDEHTTNSVYFWISQEGMAQKCFSRKDVVGIDGKTCKEFRSDFKAISPELRKILFAQPNLFDMDKLKEDKEKNETEPKNKKKRKKPKKPSLWDAMC